MKPIIFFDGQCRLCNRFAVFVFKKDKKKQFLYAHLQGREAQKTLAAEDIKNLKSLLVFQEGMIFRESEAVKMIMKKLYPRAGRLLIICPAFYFNGLYRLIAKKRYIWFGKQDRLYKANQELKKYFLP